MTLNVDLALKLWGKKARQECFDWANLSSKPTEEQQRFFDDIGRVLFRGVRGGNQCIAEGTLVATPTGPVAIELLQIGDTVYDKNGQEIKVLETHNNGQKRVAAVKNFSGTVFVYCTEKHRFGCSTQANPSACRTARMMFNQTANLDYCVPHTKQKGKIRCTWGDDAKWANTYDITVSSPDNLYLLANGLITHNSGKSSSVGREVSWLFQGDHPTWEMPDKWKDAPLQLLVLGRSQKIIEESLWHRIKGFLLEDTYREVRQGGALQKVVHLTTGNTIIFISHENANQARERVQSFTANYAWLDELPGDVKLIEELERRVQAKRGYIVLSFTPKTPNLDIQRRLDDLSLPYGEQYFFSMLDNPIYTEEDKARIHASLLTYSEGYRRTILYGDWFNGEKLVYAFDHSSFIVQALPPHYSYSWVHVETVDPAISSKFGWSLCAQEPGTGTWYVVQSAYLTDLGAPENWVEACRRRTLGYNVTRRVSDPHETWFVQTASARGLTYMTSFSKKDRKTEMIANVQKMLSSGQLKILEGSNRELISEMSTMEWTEAGNDKIVGESRYHIENTLRYFVECRPRDVKYEPILDWQTELRQANAQRKQELAKPQRSAASRKPFKIGRRSGRW